MQALSYPVAGASTPETARALLLPDVLQLLQGGAGSNTPRARAVAAREEKLRKRDADFQQLVAAAANAPRPTETTIQAERGMLPGSQAARREQMETQVRDRATQERGGFREALSQARTQGKETSPAATEKPAPAAQPAATSAGAANTTKPATAPTLDSAGKPAAAPPDARPTTPAPTSPSTTRTHVALPASAGNTTTSTTAAARDAAHAAVAKVSVAAGVARTAVAAAGPAASAGDSAAETSPAAATAAVEKSLAAGRKPAATPAAAPSAESAEAELERKGDANVERIVRLLQSRIEKDRATATLRLDPPELGTVRLHMDLRQDALALRIDADNPAARDLLRDQLDALRRNLETAGIRLEQVEVRGPEAVPTGLDTNAAQQQGAGSSPQQGTMRQRDPQSAGREPADREGPALRGSASASAEATISGPAAESLVNVWA